MRAWFQVPAFLPFIERILYVEVLTVNRIVLTDFQHKQLYRF